MPNADTGCRLARYRAGTVVLMKAHSVAVIGMLLIVASISFALDASHEYSVASWALLTLLATFVVIQSVKFNMTSFVSIFALSVVLYFPVAALANLALPFPAIDDDLWLTADLAQMGAAAGIASLVIGLFCYKKLVTTSKISRLRSQESMLPFIDALKVPSPWMNGMLVSLIVLVAFIKLGLGTYFHGSAGVYRFDNAGYNNALRWLIEVGHIGLYFQMVRFIMSESRRDFFLFFAFLVVAVGINLPSGGRTGAIGFLPLLVLAYWHFERKPAKRALFGAVMFALIISVIVAGQLFRGANATGGSKTMGQAFSTYANTVSAQQSVADGDGSLVNFVARLSDFRAVGRVIDWTPRLIPYRGLEWVDTWWQIGVPGFLRPKNDLINFQDGAAVVVQYGIYGGGSSPVMLFGDLYSRAGWLGIVIVLFVFGMLLRKLDFAFRNESANFRLSFWVLFSPLVYNMVTSSALVLVTTLTRDLLVILVIAKLLNKFKTFRGTPINLRLSHGRSARVR